MVHIIFYILAFAAICSATLVVTSINTVRGALFLVLTFFCMAGIWLLLHAEFLALTLILVYVGAVMTLFLFVVMMLSVTRLNKLEGFVRYLPIVLIVIMGMVAISIMVVGPERYGLLQMPLPAEVGSDYSNTLQLGLRLYTNYAYPFEIAAIVLLTAIVAAITLTHGKRIKKYKTQNISEQIAVRPQDRMRLVNIPSESKQKISRKGSDT